MKCVHKVDAGGSGDRLKCVHNKSESAFTQSCEHLESCLVTEHSMINVI